MTQFTWAAPAGHAGPPVGLQLEQIHLVSFQASMYRHVTQHLRLTTGNQFTARGMAPASQ
jgi:hypothetical protein